ncbi:MAG: endonuclease III, partial [Firmicutes bacterium]|nr:endonuclease III [Bacillota bacterium]
EHYQNTVPNDRDILITLPGVGRKTANVVLSNSYGLQAIAVDTHVFRVARRLGWAQAKTPEKMERELMEIVPMGRWTQAHHMLVRHGRNTCMAKNPQCCTCPVVQWCPQIGVRPAPSKTKAAAKHRTRQAGST